MVAKDIGGNTQRHWIVASIIIGLTSGLLAQFAWKLHYFPEPMVPVFIELTVIVAFATLAILLVVREN